MTPNYATPAELAAAPWSIAGLTEPDANRLIGFASRLVYRATMTAIYSTDATGLPVSTAIAGVMRDAVCSQVSTWAALSIDPAKGAADTGGLVASKGFGGATIQYAVYASSIEARATAARYLTPDALGILSAADLTSGGPVVTG